MSFAATVRLSPTVAVRLPPANAVKSPPLLVVIEVAYSAVTVDDAAPANVTFDLSLWIVALGAPFMVPSRAAVSVTDESELMLVAIDTVPPGALTATLLLAKPSRRSAPRNTMPFGAVELASDKAPPETAVTLPFEL